MNIQKELAKQFGTSKDVFFNNVEVDPLTIKAVMINEVVPQDPWDDFYGRDDSDYFESTAFIFEKAGVKAQSIADLLKMGIYITNAIKTPKTTYEIEKSIFNQSLVYLKSELALFTNTKVITLNGDVAKKAYNAITKEATGKNVVPSISTCRIRNTEIYNGSIRVIPTYIMTGGNIKIEKSKSDMTAEDLRKMMQVISK